MNKMINTTKDAGLHCPAIRAAMKEFFLMKKAFYKTSSLITHELDLKKQEIIIGLLLGDLFAEGVANVQKDPKSNTRLQFKGSAQNAPYINHLYEIFKDFCNSTPKISMSKENRPNRKSEFYFVKFWTASLPIFNKFRKDFYDEKGKKRLPLNLEALITARSLAYWAMDDGYKTKKGFYFCTESFTFAENETLKLILKNKFSLNAGVHKHTNGHRLYIHSTSINLFKEMIRPYVIKHFSYKLY